MSTRARSSEVGELSLARHPCSISASPDRLGPIACPAMSLLLLRSGNFLLPHRQRRHRRQKFERPSRCRCHTTPMLSSRRSQRWPSESLEWETWGRCTRAGFRPRAGGKVLLFLALWTMSLTDSSRVNACDREEKYDALCEEFAGEQPHLCAENTLPSKAQG